MSNSLIYKILLSTEWKDAQQQGSFKGSPLDLEDGFIHCSTVEQVPGIKEKFFENQTDLVLLSIDVTKIQETIKWEESPKSGKVYPHIYGELPLAAIIKEEKIA